MAKCPNCGEKTYGNSCPWCGYPLRRRRFPWQVKKRKTHLEQLAKESPKAGVKAEQVIKEAREKARKKAEEESARIMTESKQKAEQLAREMVEKAKKEAEQAIKEAKKKARKEAKKELARIKTEPKQKAEQLTREITERAKREAEQIIKEAREKAKKEAEEESARIMTESKQKAEQLTREIAEGAKKETHLKKLAEERLRAEVKAEQVIKEAREKARKEAEKGSAKIITESKQKAEQLAREITERTKREAEQVIKEAREKAKKEAEEESAKIMTESKQMAEQLAREITEGAREEAELVIKEAMQTVREEAGKELPTGEPEKVAEQIAEQTLPSQVEVSAPPSYRPEVPAKVQVTDKIKVFVIDDQDIFRQGLRLLLSQTDDIELVGESDFQEYTVAIIEELAPNLVLIDINLPGLSGLGLAQRVSQRSSGTSVIMLTAYEDDGQIFEALKAGVAGYLSKGIAPEGLASAIRRVFKGEHIIDELLVRPTVAQRVLKQLQGMEKEAITTPLSPQEMEMLGYFANGYSPKQVAHAMGESEQQITERMASIVSKNLLPTGSPNSPST